MFSGQLDFVTPPQAANSCTNTAHSFTLQFATLYSCRRVGCSLLFQLLDTFCTPAILLLRGNKLSRARRSALTNSRSYCSSSSWICSGYLSKAPISGNDSGARWSPPNSSRPSSSGTRGNAHVKRDKAVQNPLHFSQLPRVQSTQPQFSSTRKLKFAILFSALCSFSHFDRWLLRQLQRRFIRESYQRPWVYYLFFYEEII